ncbi:MAG: alpha/beta hydrolase [Actinomadura sp.]
MRIPGTRRTGRARHSGRPRRLRRCLAAVAVLFAVWATTTGAGGRLDPYHRPAAVPALSATTLAARYKDNRRTIAQALRTAERVRDRDRIRVFSAFLRPGRRFLAFDPRGSGRAVEVIGDLAAARRVVVLVPGADTTLTTFDTHGGKPYSAPGGDARALYDEAARLSAHPGLAVVAWLGYRPPTTMRPDAVTDERADAGAAALRRFVAGVGRVNPAARTALFCHSYGSVVCGEAARGLPTTEIVAFGSPGMSSPSGAALGTRARIWAGRGTGDWTRLLPHLRVWGMGHGADPVSRTFGARVFDAGNAGHSDYLRPDSLSLRNLTLIALDRDVEVTRAGAA